MSEQTTLEVAEVLAIDEAVTRSTGAGEFGITPDGFVTKPFARLLAEKLALAQSLLGESIDLRSGSALRKLLEISALEDARTWAALASMYDNSFVNSAVGQALTFLGNELGIQRPYTEARGSVRLILSGTLPAGEREIAIPRGARLQTDGGHHVATDQTVILTPTDSERDVPVVAFYPGPEHNLDPAQPSQKINQWNEEDSALQALFDAEEDAGEPLLTIEHTEPLTGGELRWSDARYRQLLLRAPRSVWTVDAVRLAVSLVPGVRQVQIRDGWGGLDIQQSIFGNFNFIERLFGSERDLGSPYYFTVLVAPTPAAFWEGPNGLQVAVESAIEDLRPIGIFPRVEEAEQIGVGIQADLIVEGLPLPGGSRATVNASVPAQALKTRLLNRVQQYVDSLEFGEPVRVAEVIWAIMNEPGVEDVRDLQLIRYPPAFEAVDFRTISDADIELLPYGQNLELQVNQIPVLVDVADYLQII